MKLAARGAVGAGLLGAIVLTGIALMRTGVYGFVVFLFVPLIMGGVVSWVARPPTRKSRDLWIGVGIADRACRPSERWLASYVTYQGSSTGWGLPELALYVPGIPLGKRGCAWQDGLRADVDNRRRTWGVSVAHFAWLHWWQSCCRLNATSSPPWARA